MGNLKVKILKKTILVLVVAFSACKKDGADDFISRPFTQNSIFPGTLKISINKYSYYIGDKLYVVSGDSATVQKPDTFPTTPSFSWRSTGSKLVAMAVFNSRIKVNNVGIVNTNNIVWMWHTGLNTGIEGSISYFDGRSVIDGILLDENQLKPLNNDSLYTWAVWAWDESGTKITESSIELGFIVKSKNTK